MPEGFVIQSTSLPAFYVGCTKVGLQLIDARTFAPLRFVDEAQAAEVALAEVGGVGSWAIVPASEIEGV